MISKFCWGCLGIVFPLFIFAQTPSLLQILTPTDWQTKNHIIFISSHTQPTAITELRMSFLKGEDCYSGYQQTILIPSALPMILQPNQPFNLNPESLYQIAQSLLDKENLQLTQAILIRFRDHNHGQRYEQFAWFNGACRDQDINCCIPIMCSSEMETCMPKYNMGIQFFSFPA